MFVKEIVDAVMREFKQKLIANCADVDLSELSSDLAERVCTALQSSLASAGVAGYRAYLLSFEEKADLVRAREEVFRFKTVREKTFLTPFGRFTPTSRHDVDLPAGREPM